MNGRRVAPRLANTCRNCCSKSPSPTCGRSQCMLVTRSGWDRCVSHQRIISYICRRTTTSTIAITRAIGDCQRKGIDAAQSDLLIEPSTDGLEQAGRSVMAHVGVAVRHKRIYCEAERRAHIARRTNRRVHLRKLPIFLSLQRLSRGGCLILRRDSASESRVDAGKAEKYLTRATARLNGLTVVPCSRSA